MIGSTQPLNADVIVVGTGPGGATVARALARAGKIVLILEQGQDVRRKFYRGTYLGHALTTDGRGFITTGEGGLVVRPLTLGGGTDIFAATAAEPPSWLKAHYGIDLTQDVAETVDELGIAPLPSDWLGPASTRLAEAAGDLGYEWRPLPKFMRPARGEMAACGAHCLLGCRCGAKWHAGEYVDEALEAGARLLTGVRVERVLVEDGHVIGVEGRRGRRHIKAYADVVVLAAGAIGTTRILHASGFPEAGTGMTVGVTVVVYGFAERDTHQGQEPPMTWGWTDPSGELFLSTLVDPWLHYPRLMGRQGVRPMLSWLRWHRALGIAVTLRDEISGGIYPEGHMHKPLTLADRERLTRGLELARRILVRAGADPDTILTTPWQGWYPASTVRVDDLVNENLETEIDDLYVCDASVLPESLGGPTVLTLIALGRRLARHLCTHEV